jgi:hypothetical protein
MCDKRFQGVADKVIQKRKKNEEKAEASLASAREQGLALHEQSQSQQLAMTPGTMGVASASPVGSIDAGRRWGPLDLADERPPPTAIENRRDTVRLLLSLSVTLAN